MPPIGSNGSNLGSRATVSTLIGKLADATAGNKDGIVGNEAQKPGDGRGRQRRIAV